MNVKAVIKRIPFFGEMASRIYLRMQKRKNRQRFEGSKKYWEQRYAKKGNSGVGSYGKFAYFKAEVINKFMKEHCVSSAIEYGCGDGNQLKLVHYLNYLGFDVSESVVNKCKENFKTDGTKSFKLMDEYNNETAALTLSLDVIYHLVEDEIFEAYMKRLFDSSDRYVIIYSSNTDDNEEYEGAYIRHRQFRKWIERHLNDWRLIGHIPNRYPFRGDYREGSFADFFIFQRGEQSIQAHLLYSLSIKNA